MAKKVLSILCAIAMMVTMLSVSMISVFAADSLGTVTSQVIVEEFDLDKNDWYNGTQAWARDSSSWAASCGKAEANDYGIEYVYGITPVPNDGGSRTVTLTNNDMDDDAVFGNDFEFNFSISSRAQVSNAESSVTYKLSDSVSIRYFVQADFPWSAHVQIFVDGAAVGTEKVYDLRENRDYFSPLSAAMQDFWGSNQTHTEDKYLGVFAKANKYNGFKPTFDFKAVYVDGVLSIYNVNDGDESPITYAIVDAAKFANAKVTDMAIELFASLDYNSIATYNLSAKVTTVLENEVIGGGNGGSAGSKYEEIVTDVNLDANDWYNGSSRWASDGSSWANSCGKADTNNYGIEYVYGLTTTNTDAREVTLTNNDMNEDTVFGDNFEFNFSVANSPQYSNSEAYVLYNLSDTVSIRYYVQAAFPWSSHVQIYVDGVAVGTEMVYDLRGDREDFSPLAAAMQAFWGTDGATNGEAKYLNAFTKQLKKADYKVAFDFKAVYKDGVLSIYNVNGGAEAITSATIAASNFANAKVTDMDIKLSVGTSQYGYNTITTWGLNAKTIELREIVEEPEDTSTIETVSLNLDQFDWYNGESVWASDGSSWANSCGKADTNEYGIEYVYGLTTTDTNAREVTLTNNDMNEDVVFGDNFEFNFSVANSPQYSNSEAYVLYNLSDTVSIRYYVQAAFPWSSHVQIYVDGVAVGTEMVYDLRGDREDFSPLSDEMQAFWGNNGATNGESKYLNAFTKQLKKADYKVAFDFKAVYKDGVLSIYNVNGGAEAITSATIAASNFANAKVTDMDIKLSVGASQYGYNTITTWGLGANVTRVVPGPEFDEDLKFKGASLVLGNGIGMNFYMDNAVAANYTNITASVKYVGSETPASYAVESLDGLKGFTFDKYSPNQADEDVLVKLYAEKDGVSVVGKEVKYSINTYMDNMTAKYPTNTALMNVIEAMDAYCNATTAYVDGGSFTYEGEKVTFTEEDYHMNIVAGGTDFVFAGCSLNLREVPTVLFAFRTHENINNYTFEITKEDETTATITADAFVNANNTNDDGNLYYVYYRGVSATEMRNKITGQMFNANGDAASDAVTYSVVSYAYYQSQKDDADKTVLYDLTQAMIAYGDAVSVYAAE